MDKEKFCIDMPDDITIAREIDYIVEEGIKSKKSFYMYMKEMYNQLGFRYIFKDITEIIFIIFLALISCSYIIFNFNIEENDYYCKIYLLIVIASPILYLIISLWSFISSKERKTYELEMSCKYNLYQVSVFRMLVFSIISILFNVIFIYLIARINSNIDFLRGVMIGITSLFIFAVISLYMLFAIRSRYISILLWLSVNIIPSLIKPNIYTSILTTTPIYVYFVVTSICIYFYINKLKKFIKFASVKEAV